MKRVITILVVALAFMVGSTQAANGRHGKGQVNGQGRGDGSRMAEYLQLTEEQQAKMKELRQGQKEVRQTHREKVKAVRKAIAEELKKANPSKVTLKKYADELGELHAEHSYQMSEHMLDVKEVLTPEQFEKLLTMKEEKGNKGQKRKGHHKKAHHGKGQGRGNN